VKLGTCGGMRFSHALALVLGIFVINGTLSDAGDIQSDWSVEANPSEEDALPTGIATALHEACRSGSLQKLKETMQRYGPFDPNARDERGRTPIMEIFKFGDLRILKYFCINTSNPDIYAQDSDDKTPISEAFDSMNAKIVLQLYTMDAEKQLLPHILSFHPLHENVLTNVLFEACVRGNVELVGQLYHKIKRLIYIKHRIHPIHIAVLAGQLGVVQLLSDIDPFLDLNMTMVPHPPPCRPIDLAQSLCHWKVFEYLQSMGVEKSPDISVFTDPSTWSPIIASCQYGMEAVVSKVINEDFVQFDLNKIEMIQTACKNDHVETVKVMIETEAYSMSDWETDRANHPIAIALDYDSVKCIEFFLEHGEWGETSHDMKMYIFERAYFLGKFQLANTLLRVEYGEDLMMSMMNAVDEACKSIFERYFHQLFDPKNGSHRDDLLLKASVLIEIIQRHSAAGLRNFLNSGSAENIPERYFKITEDYLVKSKSVEVLKVLVEAGFVKQSNALNQS